MGSVISSVMEESMKKSQQTMAKNQLIMMERQLHMQNLMRERQMAMQMAVKRELFNWSAAFYGIALTALLAGFKRSKKPGMLAPLLPLTFVVGYQYDFAYGTKMNRIKVMADGVLEEEQGLLTLPGGLPTIDEIELRREAAMMK